MVLAGLCIEGLFALLGWLPHQRDIALVMAQISFNYTAVLDLVFLIVALVLVAIFFRTGGPQMMRMMGTGSHGQPGLH
jgi:hypothetical protein